MQEKRVNFIDNIDSVSNLEKISPNCFVNGCCIQVSKLIEYGSVDLILTDPPYGTMKGIDTLSSMSSHDWDIAIPPSKLFKISSNLLREKGISIFFSQEPYTSNLITNQCFDIEFNYRMIWIKNKHGNPLYAKKAPLNYFEDILLFNKEYDTLNINPIRNYFDKLLDYIPDTKQTINKKIKETDHCFRTKTIQFNLPSNEGYNKLIKSYDIDKMDGYLSYSDLINMNKKYKKTFNLEDGKNCKSNVLKYSTDSLKIHPTQKPVSLLEDLIKTYSNEGDLVVDLTCGSGSTAIACINTNRKFICIEKDIIFYNKCKERIQNHINKSM